MKAHQLEMLPTITIDDINDWQSASRDSTGRCREDNPLKDWDYDFQEGEEPPEWLPADVGEYTMLKNLNDHQFIVLHDVNGRYSILALWTLKPQGYNTCELAAPWSN